MLHSSSSFHSCTYHLFLSSIFYTHTFTSLSFLLLYLSLFLSPLDHLPYFPMSSFLRSFIVLSIIPLLYTVLLPYMYLPFVPHLFSLFILFLFTSQTTLLPSHPLIHRIPSLCSPSSTPFPWLSCVTVPLKFFALLSLRAEPRPFKHGSQTHLTARLHNHLYAILSHSSPPYPRSLRLAFIDLL